MQHAPSLNQLTSQPEPGAFPVSLYCWCPVLFVHFFRRKPQRGCIDPSSSRKVGRIPRGYAVRGRRGIRLHQLGGGQGHDLHVRLGLHRGGLLPPHVPQGGRSDNDVAEQSRRDYDGERYFRGHGGKFLALFLGEGRQLNPPPPPTPPPAAKIYAPRV